VAGPSFFFRWRPGLDQYLPLVHTLPLGESGRPEPPLGARMPFLFFPVVPCSNSGLPPVQPRSVCTGPRSSDLTFSDTSHFAEGFFSWFFRSGFQESREATDRRPPELTHFFPRLLWTTRFLLRPSFFHLFLYLALECPYYCVPDSLLASYLEMLSKMDSGVVWQLSELSSPLIFPWT